MTQPLSQQPEGFAARLKGSVAIADADNIILDIKKLTMVLNSINGNFSVDLPLKQKQSFLNAFLPIFGLKKEIIEDAVNKSDGNKPLTFTKPITLASFDSKCFIPGTLRSLATHLAEKTHELTMSRAVRPRHEEALLGRIDELIRNAATLLCPQESTFAERVSGPQQQQQWQQQQ